MELFWLLIVIHLVVFLWLTVTAFTRSVLWGLLVLLIPFAAIAYGIAYFRDVKLPFLLYIATGIFAVVALVMLDAKEVDALYKNAGLMAPSDMSSPMAGADSKTGPNVQLVPPTEGTLNKDGTASPAMPTEMNKEQMPPQEGLKYGEQKPLPAKHADAAIDPLQIKKAAPPPSTVTISHNQASKYVGRYFIVVMSNKVERCGILKRHDAKNLYLQRKWNNDSVEYTIRRDQIKTVKVLKQGDRPPPCKE